MRTKYPRKKQHTHKKRHFKRGGTKKVRTVFSPSFLNDDKMMDNTFVYDDKKNEGMFCTFRKYLNDIYYDVEEYLSAINADKKELVKHGNIRLQGYDIIRS